MRGNWLWSGPILGYHCLMRNWLVESAKVFLKIAFATQKFYPTPENQSGDERSNRPLNASCPRSRSGNLS